MKRGDEGGDEVAMKKERQGEKEREGVSRCCHPSPVKGNLP